MKINILAIGIHPDDVELSCAGTLLSMAAKGYSFGILDLSSGELGTRGTPELRREEARESARILGAAFRETLAIPDGFFTLQPDNWLPIISAIRMHRPDVILCNAVDDRHPDHGRAAKLVSEAAFYAGLEKIKTQDSTGTEQERWRPRVVYHYIQDKNLTPDFVVDISAFIDKKMEAILAFRSQFYNPESKELDTPISSKEFLEYVRARNRVQGHPAGFDYAEGFMVDRIIGVEDIMLLR